MRYCKLGTKLLKYASHILKHMYITCMPPYMHVHAHIHTLHTFVYAYIKLQLSLRYINDIILMVIFSEGIILVCIMMLLSIYEIVFLS